MSGSALKTGEVARERGSKFVCDRGSSHIRFQDRILREEHKLQGIAFAGIDTRVIEREEEEYELADAITVPSSFALESFVGLGVSRSKLRLAPYGVDLTRFTPVGIPDDSNFQVLYVGRLSIQKGIPYLVDAFNRLRHARKQLTLVGTLDPLLTDLIRKATSQPNIRALGAIPQIHLREIMSRSHVMVHPSIQEGLAMVQAQAMACACPVIATENTGALDLFKDGSEGFIVPIRDSKALADRLQTLADMPDRRKQMSAAALQRVRSAGGWSDYGQRMHGIFREIAHQ